MISNTNFYYKPNDSELERASNSYLMSLVAVIGFFIGGLVMAHFILPILYKTT